MKKIIHVLGSLKLAVGLLLVTLVVLAVGTIIESLHGREAAASVYGSRAFFALLAVVAVNLIASVADRMPWGRMRIGFLVTHLSILVIFAGALTTEIAKIDGSLGLWEGQSSDVIYVQGDGPTFDSVPLGFTIRLDSFEIDHYPGTRRPAMFRSRVTVVDPETGEQEQRVIEMNRELAWGDFTFFQSSYRIEHGREMSVLSVSRDPGQTIVFIGYILLVVGMLIVLFTRIAQRRKAPDRPFPAFGPRRTGGIIAVMVAVLAGAVGTAAAQSPVDPDELREVPVLHDGRVMPLDTLARESVWKVTGLRTWVRQDPVDTVLGWTFEPAMAAQAPIIAIGSRQLAAEIGMEGHRFASFNGLVGNAGFITIVEEARSQSARDLPLSPIQEDALDLEGRLHVLNGFLTRRAILSVPSVEDPVARWVVPAPFESAADLVAAARRSASSPPESYPSAQVMKREVLYNELRPTRLSWILLVPAAVLAFFWWRRSERWMGVATSAGLVAGFVVMTWGIALRWQAAGRIPASNMYESMLFLAWGVGLFAVLAVFLVKNRLAVFNGAAMSALVMLLTDLLPMDAFIHPMPPVLAGTPWLAIHVPIIMVSYALLALAAFVAHMRLGVEIFGSGLRENAALLDEVHYWYVQLGSILLIVGILTGSIWAASSWGRYWGWDPKEVWSLIAFLAYMAILHGRIDRWLGAVGVAAASVMAFGTILMTYLGVNYVLAAGLHSYGFGGSKIATWLVIGGVVEAVYVTIGVIAYKRNQKRSFSGLQQFRDPGSREAD